MPSCNRSKDPTPGSLIEASILHMPWYGDPELSTLSLRLQKKRKKERKKLLWSNTITSEANLFPLPRSISYFSGTNTRSSNKFQSNMRSVQYTSTVQFFHVCAVPLPTDVFTITAVHNVTWRALQNQDMSCSSCTHWEAPLCRRGKYSIQAFGTSSCACKTLSHLHTVRDPQCPPPSVHML